MGFSLRCGKIAGIPIRAHASVVAVVALVGGSLAIVGFPRVHPEASLLVRAGWGIAAAVLFLLSILGHELGHAFAAKRHKIGTDGITLWLLGGFAQLKQQPETAKAEFQIAIAGPAASAVIGAAMVGAATTLRDNDQFRLSGLVLVLVGAMNLLLATSNLLPGAPLDGGRVLTAILWHRSGEPELARLTSARAGFILGIGLFIGGLIEAIGFDRQSGWITAATAVFITTAARAEIAGAFVRHQLRTTAIGAVMTRYPGSLPDTVTAHDWVVTLDNDTAAIAIPVTRWSTEPIGYCSPRQALKLTEVDRSFVTLGELMVPAATVPRAWASESITAVLDRAGARRTIRRGRTRRCSRSIDPPADRDHHRQPASSVVYAARFLGSPRPPEVAR
ncbi:MAG: site-2 protease family protein [Acidimicrobiales bacterium]